MNHDDQGAARLARDADLDLNKLLSADERALFERHMEVLRQDGTPAVSAATKATQMLRVLVTHQGKHSQPGSVHLRRETVIPLLIDALVGDEPDVDAWVEALARGTFNVSSHAGFRDPDAKTGTPGTLLPRLLNRYEKALGKPGPVSARQARDLGTGLRLLVASMLVRELQKATTAHAAMGSAWPLMRAVRGRGDRELRRLLTGYGADEQFLAHLRDRIELAVKDWAAQAGKPASVTNQQADTCLPPRVDVTSYFAARKNGDQRREDALVDFGRYLLGKGDDADAVDQAALERLLQEWPVSAQVQALIEPDKSDLPAYLGKLGGRTGGPDEEGHHAHLRFLMPMLTGPSDNDRIMACAVAAVPFSLADGAYDMTGIRLADGAVERVGRAIFAYARYIGPPPVDAPLAHVGLFQAAACYLMLAPTWPARNLWTQAGFELVEPDQKRFGLLQQMAKDLLDDSSLSQFNKIVYEAWL